MDHLNWRHLQLGLMALAFSCFQIWWIRSTLRKQRQFRPMVEVEFRKINADYAVKITSGIHGGSRFSAVPTSELEGCDKHKLLRAWIKAEGQNQAGQ
jgi:hypothetical protein